MTYNAQTYMSGRKKYSRPQALLFANTPGTVVEDTANPIIIDNVEYDNLYYLPSGYEIGIDGSVAVNESLEDNFIILSDHNRSPIDFSIERIENRQRTVNGRMRSYHVADKLKINVSWQMLPSRSYDSLPAFNASGVPTGLVTSVDNDNNIETPNKPVALSGSPYYKDQQYTVDGGAGGVDLLDWYETHQGSFWVFLSYDKFNVFGRNKPGMRQLQKYNQVVEMMFADFSYSVEKRGGSNYDFWNVSLSLEEV